MRKLIAILLLPALLSCTTAQSASSETQGAERPPGDLKIVLDQSASEYRENDEIPSKTTGFILSMEKAWDSKITTKIVEIRLPAKASTDAVFATAEGWSVFFDINTPVSVQLNSLALIVNKQVPAKDRARLAYVDLRISKVAYICYRGTPCVERPQEGQQVQTDSPKQED